MKIKRKVFNIPVDRKKNGNEKPNRFTIAVRCILESTKLWPRWQILFSQFDLIVKQMLFSRFFKSFCFVQMQYDNGSDRLSANLTTHINCNATEHQLYMHTVFKWSSGWTCFLECVHCVPNMFVLSYIFALKLDGLVWCIWFWLAILPNRFTTSNVFLWEPKIRIGETFTRLRPIY